MAHYKVLVIGADVEGQLDLFSEHREVDPYLDGTYDVAGELEAARAYRAAKHPGGAKVADLDLLRDWDGGDFHVNAAGEIERWSTCNPDGMCDWWTVGGRWPDELLLKPDAGGDWVNEAEAGLVDFEAMTARSLAAAEAEWARMIEVTQGIEIPSGAFSTFVKRAGGDAKVARARWSELPWVKAVQGLGYSFDTYGAFCMDRAAPRAAFLARASTGPFDGYRAIVAGGQWHAPDNMGWFGTFAAEADEQSWTELATGLIKAAGPYTRLTVVDCHV